MIVALVCAFAVFASAKKKKTDEEPETQVLQLPKELPNAVEGDTRRLSFYVSPLSAKGLLTQQIKDGLKAVDRGAHGDTVLHLRAFVAGSGDLRRVRELVSETFTERKQPLPSLSLVQAGALPMEGAQVVFEAITAGKKDLYPGLAFISAQAAASDNPLDPVAPLTQKAVDALKHAVQAAGADSSSLLRITCFVSSADGFAPVRKAVEAEFPRAAANYLQTQRAPQQALAACEGVAALKAPAGENGLQLRNPDGLPRVAGESQIALVSTPHLVLSGTQVSFGFEAADAKLALERLRKALEPSGVALGNTAMVRFYPLSHKIEEEVRSVREEFFDPSRPPAASLIEFEGLSSSDAGFAVDLIVAKP